MNNVYDLSRFLQAQEINYQHAFSEIQNGKKISHWMWYIFPQIKELGQTDTSKFYAINNIQEAEQYLQHPVLGNRLIEISSALTHHADKSATQIFGYPDNLKLHSCVTLFSVVPNTHPVFEKILSLFFKGKKDMATLQILKQIQ